MNAGNQPIPRWAGRTLVMRSAWVMWRGAAFAFVFGVFGPQVCLVAAVETTPLTESLALDYWDESRFATFADGVPLTVDERLEAERLVARLVSFDRRVFLASPAKPITSEQLLETPAAYRGKLVRMQGSTSHVASPSHQRARPHEPLPAFTVSLRDATGEVEVIAAEVPRLWRNTQATNQPVAVDGVFLKVVGDDQNDGDMRRPLIAAPRLAWYPQAWNPPAVTYGMSVLGILRVDVALLDRVHHRQPLGRDETSAFYQLLAGMRGTTGDQLIHWAERQLPRHVDTWQQTMDADDASQRSLAREVLRLADDQQYSVAPYFNLPDTQVGDLAVFDGVVRRAIRVEVADDLDATAAGIDHYYELALFTDDSQNNPLIFALLDLPPEFPQGDNIRTPAHVAGFFFKSWRYTSRQVDGTGGERLRIAPLFVGRSPLRIVPPPDEPFWGWIAGLGFVGLVAVLWIAAWRRSSADRAFAKSTLARMKGPSDPIDVDLNLSPPDSE